MYQVTGGPIPNLTSVIALVIGADASQLQAVPQERKPLISRHQHLSRAQDRAAPPPYQDEVSWEQKKKAVRHFTPRDESVFANV